MKAVILAGWYGSRISEESHLKPKGLIEIEEKTIPTKQIPCYGYGHSYSKIILQLLNHAVMRNSQNI